jgi:hypothetical protein
MPNLNWRPWGSWSPIDSQPHGGWDEISIEDVQSTLLKGLADLMLDCVPDLKDLDLDLDLFRYHYPLTA